MTTLHSVVAIDDATHAVDTMFIGDSPRHVHAGGSGTHSYLADFGRQRVWMLDPVDNSVVATARVASQSGVLAVSSDDELLYVADFWNGTVAMISTALMKPRPWERDLTSLGA